jgi:DNA repair exonuclease SbcCD ATPase subunit
MILKSIRLHPFGGTLDRTYVLTGPVAVVLGPNERGKSTLRQAIHHALFTSTKQTVKQAAAAVGRWYPKPTGDHAAVTLVFEHDGGAWTLTKRWGAEAASSLMAAGSAAIGDADTVHDKLETFLGHNEATGRLVLYTGQAELARTISSLKAAGVGDEIRSVADVLAQSVGALGSVGPERLRKALAAKIEDCFNSWDRASARPKRDSQGRERGPRYRWANKVGPILKAWYGWQTKREELAELRTAEEQFDDVSAALAALEAQMAADRDFLAKGGPLRDGLGERRLLEAKLQGFRTTKASLAEIIVKWPAAEAGVTAASKQLNDLQTQKQALVAEQANATRRAEAEQQKNEFAALLKARQEWLDASEAANASFQPPAEAVAELERLAEQIKDARNRIEAQKLAYEIAATEPLTIRIEEAAEPPREVSVGGGLSGVAKSRLRVEARGLTVIVTSGEGDVAALFQGLDHDMARERALLAECRAESLVDVKAAAKRHAEFVAAAAFKKSAWEARLRGKTFEQWQEEIDTLVNLPQTRDAAVLAIEIEKIDRTIGEENGTLRLHQENVKLWTEKYETQQKLLSSLVKLEVEVESSETRLKALPTVPEGFATPDLFLEELTRREAENRDRPAMLKELATSQQTLMDKIGDRSTTELAEESDRLEQAFTRTLREGQAYERILEVLDEVESEQETDPLAGFTAKVTDWFGRITGGAEALQFDADLPTQVTRGPVATPPDYLSQGAVSALALVLRLALAEVHLGTNRGFIVLDDPFVDIDAERRERAKDLLRTFADRHQVIFITCHEPHAAGLGESSVVTPP